MNEFKFYGEENRENDDAVQLREQQAEKEAEKERKYKKHSVLDNTALFLFIVLIAEKYSLQQEYFSKKKCMQKLCLFLWNCLYLFWAQAFFRHTDIFTTRSQ